jgi:pyrroloquinoline quinone (PQQ) biosynthesis protein C
MSQLPGWMPELLSLLNQACAQSPMFTITGDDEKVFQTGKDVCLSLWPFIRELPDNVSAIRQKTPAHMEAAIKLFSQLADENRVYQQLYLKQCQLAGITEAQLENVVPSVGAMMLSAVIKKHCLTGSYEDGVLAIITAELAATAWARSAQPVFDTYFANHAGAFDAVAIEEGLSWLRLHSEPNLKHAKWLRRLLGDLSESSSGKTLPPAVVEVLRALYAVLQVEQQNSSNSVDALTLIS